MRFREDPSLKTYEEEVAKELDSHISRHLSEHGIPASWLAEPGYVEEETDSLTLDAALALRHGRTDLVGEGDPPAMDVGGVATPDCKDSLCSRPNLEASIGLPKGVVESGIHDDKPSIGERRSQNYIAYS